MNTSFNYFLPLCCLLLHHGEEQREGKLENAIVLIVGFALSWIYFVILNYSFTTVNMKENYCVFWVAIFWNRSKTHNFAMSQSTTCIFRYFPSLLEGRGWGGRANGTREQGQIDWKSGLLVRHLIESMFPTRSAFLKSRILAKPLFCCLWLGKTGKGQQWQNESWHQTVLKSLKQEESSKHEPPVVKQIKTMKK